MKRFLIFALGLMITGLIFAEGGDLDNKEILTLNVDQAVSQALAHNIGLQSEGLKTQVKKRERESALNRFIPTLTASAALSHTNEETTVSGLMPVKYSAGVYEAVVPYSVKVDPWNLTVNFSAQLAVSLAIFRGIDQTVIDFDNSVISQEMASKKLVRDVKKSFYQLLALQESLKLTERQVSNAEKRYLLAQEGFKSGLVSKLAVLQSRVVWENRRPALEEQRLGYRQMQMALLNLMGLDPLAPVALVGAIPQPEWPASVPSVSGASSYISGRLDVLQAEGGAHSLENVIRLQSELLLPALIFSWSADPSVNAPFEADAFSKSTAWKQRSGVFAVMLRWQMDSLLPFSTSGVQISNLRDQLAQAQLGVLQTRRSAAMEIEILLQRLKKTKDSLVALNLNAELAAEAYQQTELSYRSGGQSLLEVQESETQLQSAQTQVLMEKNNFTLSLLDLEFALNTNKETFLKGESK